MSGPEAVLKLRKSVANFCRQGRLRDALSLLDRPLAPPDYFTFTSIIEAVSRAKALPEAKLVHAYLLPFLPTYPKRPLTIAYNHLIRMYDQCGDPLLAFRVFESMPYRNEVSYNLMIAVHARTGQASHAFQLLIDMYLHHIGVDRFSFISVISSCVNSSSLFEGKMSHMLLVFEGLDCVDNIGNADIGNVLITFYGTCACLDDALRTFHMMPIRKVVAWNAIIAVYFQHGHGDVAFQLYAQMQIEGMDANRITCMTLLAACAVLVKLDEGKKTHMLIQASGLKLDVVLGTALVDMYSKCGDVITSLKVFNQMQSWKGTRWKVESNSCSMSTHLNTSASACNLGDGEPTDVSSVDSQAGTCNTLLSSLLSMNSSSESSEHVFAALSETSIQDTISWNALISAKSQHGHSNQALDLFREMLLKDVKPSQNTFISVLSACSHTGMLTEGLLYYIYMFQDCRCVPLAQHNTCMIDLFGRAGRLKEAEDFSDKMPFQPEALQWMALASACRVHSFIDRARCAAHQALELDPLVPQAYVALSNICTLVYRWDGDVAFA